MEEIKRRVGQQGICGMRGPCRDNLDMRFVRVRLFGTFRHVARNMHSLSQTIYDYLKMMNVHTLTPVLINA